MLTGIKKVVLYNIDMNIQDDVEILPEDRVQLTTDQKNLIVLALEKQLPFEDAEFLEKVQKKASSDSYTKINKYFVKSMDQEFGEIYLAAITGGEENHLHQAPQIFQHQMRKINHFCSLLMSFWVMMR